MHLMGLLLVVMAAGLAELVAKDSLAANFAPSSPCAQLGLIPRLVL